MRRRERESEPNERRKKRRKVKHQVHFVGFHSAKYTRAQTDQAARKKTLAAEHRVVRQEEKHNDTRAD